MHTLALRSLNPWRLSLAVVLVLLASRALAAPGGELDAAFGDHGRIDLDMGNTSFSGAVSQQDDGKLLFAGRQSKASGGNDFAVLRLNPDGSVDNTFGKNGIATVDFNNSATATKVAVQPDGRILVVGSAEMGASKLDFALARLNADGTMDSTFGNHGLATLDLGGSDDAITDVVLLQNGMFVVVGSTFRNSILSAVFARFGMNGTLDSAFGTGPIAGTVIVNAGQASELSSVLPFAMIKQADGRLVACGSYVFGISGWGDAADALAIRVNTDGSLDQDFGTNGVSRIQTSGGSGAESCVAMPDGRLVLLVRYHPALVRLLPDGTLDAAFGLGGISSIADDTGAAMASTVIPLTDGTLAVSGAVVFGTPQSVNGEYGDLFVAHLDAEGRLDAAFGDNGVTMVPLGFYGFLSVFGSARRQGLIEQPNHELIVAGAGHEGSLVLARIDPAGSGSNGFARFEVMSAAVAEDSGSVVVTVKRTGGSTGPLTVDYATRPGTATAPGDFTAVSGTLTWPSGDMTPKSITVPISSDTAAEATEQFAVMLSNSTGGLASGELSVSITESPPVYSGSGNGARGGDSGGGGGLGLGELAALALISSLAILRRRRCSLSGASRAS